MIYLILSIICSALISIVMRLAEDKVEGRLSMLASNNITCMIVASMLIGWTNLIPSGDKVGLTLSLATVNGAFYLVGLVLAQVNIRKNGVVLPNVFSKLGGLIIPLVISVCIFGEVPKVLQVIGALIAMVSIVAINSGGDKGMVSAKGLLVILFIVEGFASVTAKIFDELANPLLSDHFLLVTFGSAFVFCMMLVLKNKEKFGIREFVYGAMIGVPNFFASRFMLKALATMPAVIVYPMRGVGGIVLVSLAGVLMFKERLTKRQWCAMAAILVSVALLNM